MKSKIIINNGSTIKKRRYFIHWELNFHVTINVKSIKISSHLFQPSSFLSRSYFHHSLFSSRLIIAFHPSLASSTNGCQPSTRTKVASHVIDDSFGARTREKKGESPWNPVEKAAVDGRKENCCTDRVGESACWLGDSVKYSFNES